MPWKFLNKPKSERWDDSAEEDAETIEFQVNSTCVAQAKFQSDGDNGFLGFAGTGNLFITFVSDGRTYQYSGFPSAEFESFRVSYSKGQFFNRNIRDSYEYEEVF